MKKGLISTTLLFSILFCIFLILSLTLKDEVFITLAISFGICSYQFGIRLFLASIINKAMHNSPCLELKYFKVRSFEIKIYNFLRVKSWKKLMPTYKKQDFDMKKKSLIDLRGATCQAEIVHELNVIFSFLPMILVIWFNPSLLFLLTSILTALIDVPFIVIQRYNRYRIDRLIDIKKSHHIDD